MNERAQELVRRINEVLAERKLRVQMLPGDFIGVANNFAIHAKDVVAVRNPDLAWQRWTVKTVNIDRGRYIGEHLMPGSQHIVLG